MSKPPSLIVDLGSQLLKAGICTDKYQDKPYSDNSQHARGIPTTWTKSNSASSFSASRVRIPGQISNDSVISRKVPCIERGNIVNTQCLEEFLKNVYDEMLKVDPDERDIVLTTPTMGSRVDRRWLLQHHFETLGFESISLQNQCVMSLYSVGLQSGLSLNIGHGLTQIVPIAEGTIVKEGASSTYRGGIDIDRYMKRLLDREGCVFISSDECTVRKIKEQCGMIVKDFKSDMASSMRGEHKGEIEVELPDGTPLKVSSMTRMMCPEILFRPEISENYSRGPGVSKALINSLQECPLDTFRCLVGNIVVGGGSTKFPGFKERLHFDMSKMLQKRASCLEFKCDASVYVGAQIFAHLDSKKSASCWFTQDQYSELGVGRILAVYNEGGV